MEKTYEKIKMHIMCNGSFRPNQYLCTQLYKAIAKACYESPLTIEEISLATGVPTLYLEDALEHMIWGDAIEQTGNKYATNFIITSDEQNIKMRSFLNEAVVGKVTDTILQYIGETEEKVRDIGFFGRDFSFGRLCENRNGRTFPAMPVFNQKQYGAFSEWSKGCEELDSMWEGWLDSLFAAYRKFTPKRLNDQIGGNVDMTAILLISRPLF